MARLPESSDTRGRHGLCGYEDWKGSTSPATRRACAAWFARHERTWQDRRPGDSDRVEVLIDLILRLLVVLEQGDNVGEAR
jgi:hypothetical protein